MRRDFSAKMRWVPAIWMLSLTGLLGVAPCSAASLNTGTQAALAMFHQSLSTGQSAPGDALLRSLRQMRDPALKPFFERLARSESISLRIHGILGAAAVSSPAQLNLAQLASIKSPSAMGSLLTAAIDEKLLSDAQIKQLMSWKTLSRHVKVLLIARRFKTLATSHQALLEAAAKSKNLGERGLASLLLYQMNDPLGLKGLESLDQSQSSQRDTVRAMLLAAALQDKFERVQHWAYAVMTQPGVDPRLALLAQRVAMRFGNRRADESWLNTFTSTRDMATRLQLAMLALHTSPYLPASLFKPLVAADDPLLKQIGRTGEAIAAGKPDAADQIVRLIQMQYPPANAWAFNYSDSQAKADNARMIDLALIVAYKQGPRAGRMLRLNTAVQAAQKIYEGNPAIGGRLLRPVLASSKTDPMLVKGILLALVRTRKPGAAKVIAGLHNFNSLAAGNLATLLRAKHNVKLTRGQLRDLALIVEGGSSLDPSLQIQAAWCYLKQTRQTQLVLKQLRLPS